MVCDRGCHEGHSSGASVRRHGTTAWIPIGLAAAALMRGPGRPRVASVFAVLLVSFVVGLGAVPAYAATCSGGTTMTIDLAGGESIALSLSGGADPLAIVVTPSDPSCGGFDTSTVTAIHVNGTGGNETVTIDQTESAPFPHQNTVSIDLALGDGTDLLVITGQSTADAIGFGVNGISLDAGGTPDVTGVGTVESSTVNAGDGDDTVSGREGGGLGGVFAAALTIDGGGGDDALTGGHGDDEISGGSGNDTLKSGAGDDTLDGGSGADVVSGSDASDVVMGGSGNDQVRGGDGGDTLDGDAGGDTLTGGEGADTVNGGEGNDRLKGGGNDDDVNGDPGRDELAGGRGNDRCLGGPDPDSITGCETGHP
jgi:Ca2+-binding RTX toxin-like protein